VFSTYGYEIAKKPALPIFQGSAIGEWRAKAKILEIFKRQLLKSLLGQTWVDFFRQA